MKGIDASATLTGPDGLAEPLVPWFAYEGDDAWSRIGGESGYRFGEIGSDTHPLSTSNVAGGFKQY